MAGLRAPFEAAAYCWVPGLEPARNQFVSFERRFRLDRPQTVALHLFADTRYRLWVDGRFAAYGPARFVTQSPEYDTHELELEAGGHVLRVEVNFYGASSYQTMPDGRPGFLAAGGTEDGSVRLDSPGEWRSRLHRAWDPEAPLFSFAQNPVEICDTRMLERELAEPADGPVEALPAERCPWGQPLPRSVPYPGYEPMRPHRVRWRGRLAAAPRWGFQVRHPAFLQGDRRSERHDCLFRTWILSPIDQEGLMECFWSDLWLNGEPLRPEYGSERFGNHGTARVRLRAGWNRLIGRVEVLTEHWSYLLGFPGFERVSLHSRPDPGAREAFELFGPMPAAALPDPMEAPEEGWRWESGDPASVAPGRWVAWQAGEGPDSGGPVASAHGALWCLDFGDEYYGQPVLEVEAPEGTLLDVSYDDWTHPDGRVRLYGSNPFVDATDRFVLRGGRQTVHAANPRGGIALQLTFTPPPGLREGRFDVQDVRILRRTLLPEPEGAFACPAFPTLEWAWGRSLHTLAASTDEGYADCPWRERGSYIGDGWVNLQLHRLATPDLRVALRTFDLFGQAQLPDGQLPCCAPAWLRQPHEDFSLLWVLAVRELADSPDGLRFLERQWPRIERLWASERWRTDPETGLWDASGLRVFLDWGVPRPEREGRANAALNVLRVEAHRATADIASAIGRIREAESHRLSAEQVCDRLLRHVWLRQEGRFAASLGAQTPALHANTLALRFGVGPREPILRYLEPLLRENLERGLRGGESAGHLELYFLSFALPALAEAGRPDLAEHVIEGHYGYLRSLGLPTLPECFHRVERGAGSCCHSWSGAAAIYGTAYVLGLRRPDPFQPERWVLDPIVSDALAGAGGRVPTRFGPIEARWERTERGIEARVRAPNGVVLQAGPGVARLRID
ncbi:MAG: hypothetical protein N2109_09735 [Fimbriimonadales bacterium]|nr:hypothetical protein [Fimbriimonadales bacterium]